MISLKPSLLALTATLFMADSDLNTHASFPSSPRTLFQTTRWLNLAEFAHDRDTWAELVDNGSGIQASLQLAAPQGGKLSAPLHLPADYAIKKILLCSNQNRPINGISLRLTRDSQASAAMPLLFERMSYAASGCAVYAPADGVDGWGRAGQTFNANQRSTLAIIFPPSATPAEIEAVGLRLQAAAPPYLPPGTPRQWQTRQEDMADVYFTSLDSRHNSTHGVAGPTPP